MNRFWLALLAAAAPLLFGCATPGPPAEPRVEVKESKVPTPISCVPSTLAPPPTFSDSRDALKAAPGAEDRYRLMAGNWFPRDVRLTLLEGIVSACRKPPGSP